MKGIQTKSKMFSFTGCPLVSFLVVHFFGIAGEVLQY